MKRSEVLNLVTSLVGEKANAELVVSQLEKLKLLKPTHKKIVTRRDIECMPYEDYVTVEGWEEE
jgi:hypothetical protein